MISKIRFVVADDERHIRSLMMAMITSIGYEAVGWAENGEQAIELYRKMRPDVLLLDINMPLKSGIDVLHEVISLDPAAVVIMLTSINSLDVVSQCLSSGAKHYILKDNSTDNMRAMLEEAVSCYVTESR